MIRTAILFTIAAFGIAPVFGASACESLTALKLQNVSITGAATVAAGAFTSPLPPAKGKQPPSFKNLPAFCRVSATLTPSSDSEIKIEVWLPESGWNGNLQSVGNGAWAGTISYPAMATALEAGYASASTDTGHTGGNPATFIPGHPEKVIDFSYRAVHEMTVAAKAIITARYGNGPKYSYWNGCSTGGRQALTEAQRYAADYDGIIAGAAAIYTTHLQGAQVWSAAAVHKDPASYIPPAKYAVLHAAVLEACDELDGAKDGVLENPTKCRFDPKKLLCKDADGLHVDELACLTAPQMEAARKLYAGPVNSRGKSLFPGLERGSETGWATLSGTKPMALAEETYKFLVFQDANWNYLTFDAERDMALADQKVGPTMNSIDPNLRPLFARGGKVLMYHGWADPGIAPRNSVNYYESVVERLGQAATSNSLRLFMVPGMGHCQGGDGTSTFSMIDALSKWVEQGKAPERIEASRVRGGQTDRTRPLCPYPQVAVYKGSGSTDDSANFSCKVQ
ncbi:MAG TPA: tannase/feruloyl esterase family alpha/beta hydrolase [Bryobacteraceae bacterium]|nr:tannase/feruloyl esterase family alpha/beta hydrolase [Bryobacteraceae bacterium]